MIMLEFEDERRNKIEVEETSKLAYYFQTLRVPINRLIKRYKKYIYKTNLIHLFSHSPLTLQFITLTKNS